MPTYEFRCPEGHEFEKFYRTISGAESQAACPTCGKQGERMMSAAGFAFKGSGFYLTDYGKNAHREKGTAAPKSGESSARESGSEAPAAKTESAGTSSTAASDTPKAEKKPESKPAEAKPASTSKPSSTE
jgi:putative FmdB family regulatory protein